MSPSASPLIAGASSGCDAPRPRRSVQPADGPATVLAIGTANPPTAFLQSDYPDFYFNITDSNHMTDLKRKFQRICDKSGIRNRFLFANEDVLRANPNMCAYWANSLNARHDIMVEEIPKMAKQAAAMALQEWGRPKSSITHLIFCTTGGMDLPGADWALVQLLGLRSDIRRVMLYSQGCFAGGTVLRVAKDLAENNRDARVLVVCSEMTVTTFRGPTEAHLDSMVGQALFGDGAAALIVGADPLTDAGERPWFEIHNAVSSIVPNSGKAIMGHLREVGLTFHLMKEVPTFISTHISGIVADALNVDAVGEPPADMNDLFWIAHPGGPAILDDVQKKLGLKPERMAATRHVLSEFGNMSSACVHFIMDHMRRRSAEQGLATSGEGRQWGLLLGFGPGLTIEAVLLRSVPLGA